MYPSEINTYMAPNTLEEALEILDAHGEDALCIAGGQSLMQAMKSRFVQPKCLVDLQHIAELRGIDVDSDGIHIGAMTRYRDIAADSRLHGAYQALNDAAAHVGDRQVRNRGTIGGSLCWNYIAACMPPTAIGLGAELGLAKRGAQRRVPAEDFIRSPLETSREANEILSSVDLPNAPQNSGSAYKKWGLLKDALPVVGVCAMIGLNASGACTSARIAIGGVDTGPRRVPQAEAALTGLTGDDRDGIAAAANAAADETQTQDDLWADKDYRKQLIRILGAQVIATSFARANGGSEHA